MSVKNAVKKMLGMRYTLSLQRPNDNLLISRQSRIKGSEDAPKDAESAL
jgi:hypothetical protein